MQKIKKRGKLILLGILLVSLVTMNGYLPKVDAAMTSVSDTLSDSDTGATDVTHTIEFTIGTALTENQYFSVTVPAGFSNFATTSIQCPHTASTTTYLDGSSVAGWEIRCVVDAGETIATGTKTIIATSTQNHVTQGDYTIGVATKNASNEDIEARDAKIYIIDEVSVSAKVDATLTFSLSTTTPDNTVNGISITATSSPTSIAFGTLTQDTDYVMGHQLAVSTNADNGYSVTVEQDQELQTGAGAIIDSAYTAATSTWSDPTGDYNDATTWGHWSVTSDDVEYFDTETGASAAFQGLDGTNPLTVMGHDGPVNASVVGVGTTTVAYKLRVTALQEAGDYSNTLTYICTPTY